MVIQHNLGIIFRDKNLVNARTVLDSLQLQAETEEEIIWKRSIRYSVPITRESLITAQFLLAEFTNQGHDNYKLRCEHPFLNIYSNDLAWMDFLMDKNLSIESFSKIDTPIVSRFETQI